MTESSDMTASEGKPSLVVSFLFHFASPRLPNLRSFPLSTSLIPIFYTNKRQFRQRCPFPPPPPLGRRQAAKVQFLRSKRFADADTMSRCGEVQFFSLFRPGFWHDKQPMRTFRSAKLDLGTFSSSAQMRSSRRRRGNPARFLRSFSEL